MASLCGKVIILTGAAGVIGSKTATYLAKFKPRLVLAGRNSTGLEHTYRACKERGLKRDELMPMETDLKRDCDLENLVSATLKKFGQIDVLINNAGVAAFKTLCHTDISEFDYMMAINVRAPLLLTKICAPHLIASKGCVINVSSVLGQIGMPHCLGYSMSKACLDHFSRTVAADLAQRGVRVNTISPGFMRTNIGLKQGIDRQNYEEYMAIQAAMTPLGRYAEARDIARMIAFLASDDAAFITGEIIRVDGGRGVSAPILKTYEVFDEPGL
ncbi:hypothetical protein C0Q70_17645 [Pomacea canaliculata]|uniref:Ketoreductase domain-containing protein n=1 Tax=Pomacea canaliculata TaxID=400727 RepID=A0A2T7NKZ6_POMCA|nr:uncharacterized protein LOC112575560 [Pomacea canaliculata]PVD21843.1 hypothetical protein C0Q70_17645 [Pomacea canaliculata]